NVTVNELGSYYVKVNTPDNCSATSNTIDIRDSISNKVFITPNPNRGQFQVRYSAGIVTTARRMIIIYDSKGARVYMKSFILSSPYSSMDIDIRQHGKGVYFLIISDVNGNKLTEGKVSVL
ncbi:MAG: T9SS type A sorting domain-containing protein, partial [Ferruginibacter sp.]